MTQSFAQCPTVTNANQSFCDTENPTVGSLLATNNGGGIRWYAEANTPAANFLSTATPLVDGEDYFADDNTGACGPRQVVTVSVYTKPTVSAQQQGFCEESTVSDLQATGNQVQWYTSATGGTALLPTTILINNTFYWASQVNPNTGCETSRQRVFVTVRILPTPTGPAVQHFCTTGTPTVANLTANGTGTIIWYPSPTSGVELSPSTPLINGQFYYAADSDEFCESLERLEVQAIFDTANNAGTNGALNICAVQIGSTPPVNLFSLLGGSPSTSGTWTGPLPTSNGNLGTVNVSGMTVAGSPYVFSYTVAQGVCPPAVSTVTIRVLPMPTAAIAANTTICSGQSATVTFTGTPNATVTYNINGGPNQTIVLNASGTATITNTYTATTVFNLVGVASATTPSCTQALTGSITITVLPLPTVAIAANTTICSGGTATVTFTGTPNATVTYNINGGPNQTIVLNASGTGTITNTYTATTTFNLVSVVSSGTPACTRPVTGTVVITVIPPPTVTISANTTICPGQSATVTFTGTPNATVTYNINGGPNQAIVLNAAGTAAITNTYTATTVFNLVSITSGGTPACTRPVTGTVTITVLPLPTVSIAANTTICSGQQATVTFTGTPNATVTYTVNGGPNQTIVLSGSGTATITNTYTATTVYTLVSVASSGAPSCSQPATGTITITVLPLPTVTIAANTTICPGQSTTVTFTGTPNAIVTYNINGGPNQTITLNAAGTATITNTYTVTTVFNLVSIATTGTPGCTRPVSGTVTITVLPLPTVSIAANATICSGQSATVTFTGTPNATVTYNINGGPNQTIVLNGSGTATITNTYTVTTVFNLISVASSGTPSCSQPATGSITITVLPLPTVTISANQAICSGQQATVTFTGTPNATVTYNINGGPNQTIVLNASGTATITNTYTVTTVFNLVSVSTTGTPSCSQPATGSITITVLPVPVVVISSNQTICSGQQATVTFTGTPNATVTYTINGGPNQMIVLNASGTATITNTYTATTVFNLISITTAGSPGCTQPVSGSITITVVPLPVVAISSDATVCPNGSATITFTGTPNATVTYTVNGGPNQTIVLDAAGTATITGNYTVTTVYTLVSISTTGTPICSQPATGTVTITVAPLPTAGISANATICSGQQATVTFTGTPNATVTYNINGGPNQTIILNASGTATITNTYTATTIYNLVSVSSSGTPGCSQPVTGSITITVLQLPTVSISSNASVCPGGSATITFAGTPNATVTYTVNGGPNQTIVLNASGTATLTNTYTVTTVCTLVSVATSGTPSCSQPVTGSVTITVVPLPTASISSTITTVCSGQSATVIFTGTPNAIVTYTINGGPNQNITLNAAGTASITGNYTATTIFALVSVTTSGTPACTQLLTGTTTTITVVQPPIAGNNAAFSLCANGSPQDLFLLLGSSAQPGGTWSPALASGSGLFNPAVDPSGTYTYTLAGTPPCLNASASVVVTVTPPANAGTDGSANLCSNADPVNLFNYLGGGAQTGGTWTPALASGTGIFNPDVDAAGTYTYTITGTPPCANDTATVTITITPGPDAGTPGTAAFCLNSAPQDLFLSLGGTPQVGGTWSPALASGTGVFDPAVDPAGVYTYTFEGNQPCDDDSATVTVTINPIPDAGQDGTAFFCTNYPAADLFTFLGGAPQTGGTWSPALASGTGVFNPLIDAPGVYTYTVGGGLCSTDTATVTVSVSQSPNAGGAGATLLINACATDTAVDLFTGLNGSQGVGTWNDDDATGALAANIFNASQVGAGTYHFTYTVGGGVSPCLTDSATVTVVVNPIPNAGTFNGPQSFCNAAGTINLFTLISGYQTGGDWVDSNNLVVSNNLDISGFAPGMYNYSYVITNPCGSDTETVQFTIVPNPTLTNANIVITTPVCLGSPVTVNLVGLADGAYLLTYNLSGSNNFPDQPANVTISGGTGSFQIAAIDLPNTGVTTITFVNIGNIAANCITTLTDVSANFTVNPIANLDSANISIANICLGSDAVVLILNASGLANGTYQFNYDIPGGNPVPGIAANVAIANGSGQFTVPGSVFSAGNYTLTITQILTVGGCNNASENASASFTVHPVPNATGASVTAGNQCYGFDNAVQIAGATNLTDGIYAIDYNLSGANMSGQTVSVTFAGGVGTFNIPTAALQNPGSTTLTVTQLTLETTTCGISGVTFNAVTFDIIQVGTPVLEEKGNEFCGADNPTIADLSANITGTEPVFWYDAPTGGTIYDPADLLTNGTTYYASYGSPSICESIVRLEVTVDLTQCKVDEILVPDGFSPNGDGINDAFVIKNLRQLYPGFRLEIYNRYGNILYKGNYNSPDWDGSSTEGGVQMGGNLVPAGVYFYILEFNDGIRKPVQGRVYLSR